MIDIEIIDKLVILDVTTLAKKINVLYTVV